MAFNVLKWGSEWLSSITAMHTESAVLLKWGNYQKLSSATLVDEQGRVIPQEVKVASEFTRFMFNTGVLVATGAPLRRGLIIVYDNQEYEVVVDGGKAFYYNDQYRKHTIVVTKHVQN